MALANSERSGQPNRRRHWLARYGFALVAASLAILAAAGWQSARNLHGMAAAAQMENHARITIQAFQNLLSILQDAETGQRGYLLSGDDKYLAPYQTALNSLRNNLVQLKQLTTDSASQRQRIASLEPLVAQKLAELKQTIQLRRAQGLPAALAVVNTGAGKNLMDQLRGHVAAAQAEEENSLQRRKAITNAAAAQTLQGLLAGGALSFLLLITVFYFLQRENARRVEAEAEVRQHRDHLQELVAKRTEALSRANEDLTREIDQHRQARQALRQQREWLSITLASIGDAVLATDTAGRVTFLNPVAEELTGWRESAALGQPVQSVFRVINEPSRTAAPDLVAQVLRDGQTVALANHTALIARDGREIPIEDSAAPIKDEVGQILGVVLVFHDVTKMRRDQAALLEREEQLRLFVEYAPAAIAMLDAQMRYLAASRQWLADYHLLEQPVLGRSHYEIFPEIPERWKAIHRRCLAGIVESSEEDLFERSDGAKQWIRWQIRPWHLASGAVGGIIIFTEDITERKQAERQVRLQSAALQAAANGIAIISRAGAIEWVNDAFTRLTGYRAAEAIGQNPRVLKSGLHPAQFYADMWATIVSGQVWHGELVNKRKDGTLYQEEMTVTPVRGDQGGIIHFIAIKQDITARKQAEAALRASEEEFRALFEHMENGFAHCQMVFDDAGRAVDFIYLKVNQAFGRLTGLENVTGRRITEILPGLLETHPEHLDADERVVRTGQPECLESRFKPLAIWLRLSIYRPAPGEFAVIFEEITERKRRESNLTFLTELHQAFAPVNSEAEIMRLATERIAVHLRLSHCLIVQINEAADEAAVLHDHHATNLPSLVGVYRLNEFHTAREQALLAAGKALVIEDVRREPRSADQAAQFAALGIGALVNASYLAKGRWQFVLSAMRGGPCAWPAEDVALLVELAARVCVRIERARAEEALRESENRFRLLANSLPQLAWTARPDGHIFWYNQRWYDYTGTTPAQMEGWGWQSVHDPVELPKVLARWKASIATGQQFEMTFPLRAADGGFRPFLTRVIPLKNATGAVQQWFGTNTDVNELKQAEELLEHRVGQRTAELKAANHELEAFCYSVAHDLRAPLRGIDGFSLAVLEDYGPKLDAEGQGFLHQVRAGCQQMGNLIDALLKLSRVSRAPMTRQPVNLAALARRIAGELQRLAPQRAAQFRIPAQLMTEGDPTLLEAALRNLLENAWKFTAKQAETRIEMGVQPPPDGPAADAAPVFFVRDNGAGFDMTYADKLFAPFQRLHSKSEFLGTGIGLATVQRILQRHGGRIWAEAAPGQGATFYFTMHQEPQPKGPSV